MTHTVIIFDQLLCARTQTDWLIWLRPPFDPTLVPGLTLLTSPQTTYFIFTKTVSSPHAVIGLLMREQRCEGHPSEGKLHVAWPPSHKRHFNTNQLFTVGDCSCKQPFFNHLCKAVLPRSGNKIALIEQKHPRKKKNSEHLGWNIVSLASTKDQRKTASA